MCGWGASGREPWGCWVLLGRVRGAPEVENLPVYGAGVGWLVGRLGPSSLGLLGVVRVVLPPSPPRDCCRPHRTRQGNVELLISGVGGLDPCGAGGGLAAIGEGGRVVEVPTAPGPSGPRGARSGRSRPDPFPLAFSWARPHYVTGEVTKSPLQVGHGAGRVPAVAGSGLLSDDLAPSAHLGAQHGATSKIIMVERQHGVDGAGGPVPGVAVAPVPVLGVAPVGRVAAVGADLARSAADTPDGSHSGPGMWLWAGVRGVSAPGHADIPTGHRALGV